MVGFNYPPTPFDLKFRLLGVDARIHWTFWLGGLLFTRGSTEFSLVLTGIATLFISILVHEMGHALSGKYFGDRVPSITLHAMGGHYTPGYSLRHRQFVWMIIWGPLAGFILGGVAVAAWYLVPIGILASNKILFYVIWDAMWINIVWGVVNLLPVFPLDGGQVLREVLRWRNPSGDDVRAYTVSMVAAVIVAALMAALNVLNITSSFGLYPILLFGFLAYNNYVLRKYEIETGGMARHEELAPRQPWERDADWWKNGGKSDDTDSWKR